MADHPHTIDRWDDATGENLIEQIAGVSDYLVAVETYRAAVKRWPGAKITLRNRARVIEQSWEDAEPHAARRQRQAQIPLVGRRRPAAPRE
jgi:hypothetical protein